MMGQATQAGRLRWRHERQSISWLFISARDVIGWGIAAPYKWQFAVVLARCWSQMVAGMV